MNNLSMLVNATRQNNALTFNGAVTHSTSLSACLDLFAIGGAARTMSESDIRTLFERARGENKRLAYMILFWIRDCRGGAGEKRFFQVVMKYISQMYPAEFTSLLIWTQEFGNWKDVFEISKPNESMFKHLQLQLTTHPHANLLAKWFPRKGPWFSGMHKYLKVSPKEFRKGLVGMTQVVETQMCNKDFKSIDYSKVPSVAMHRYRTAFYKQDLERMTAFIEAVKSGEQKINASVLFPHQLYDAMKGGQNADAVTAQWNALPDYMADSTERILPICDVSGSMSGLPMSVSVSLGIYISERNKSIFKDAFITFSGNPEMQVLSGDLAERMRQLESAEWGMNTDLQAVFSLILDSAKRENLPSTEMPTKLLIISDMEFDQATDSRSTNLDVVRARYANAGYELPEIVFWNVNGRMGNSPASKNDEGIGLVSGFSPAILKSILKGKVYTPHQLMLDTVDVPKYQQAVAEI